MNITLGGWGGRQMDTERNGVQKVPSVCQIRVKYFGLTLAKFSLQVVPDNEGKIFTLQKKSQMPREGEGRCENVSVQWTLSLQYMGMDGFL